MPSNILSDSSVYRKYPYFRALNNASIAIKISADYVAWVKSTCLLMIIALQLCKETRMSFLFAYPILGHFQRMSLFTLIPVFSIVVFSSYVSCFGQRETSIIIAKRVKAKHSAYIPIQYEMCINSWPKNGLREREDKLKGDGVLSWGRHAFIGVTSFIYFLSTFNVSYIDGNLLRKKQ